MSISIFGIIFIPAAIWIFLFHPRYLVALMMLASVFAAASVVDVSIGDSDFGLQPYYLVAMLLAIRAFPVVRDFYRAYRSSVLQKFVLSLLGFWLWATFSAFVFPVVFSGIQVIDPYASGADYVYGFSSRTLQWSFGNLGQVVYLTLNVVAVLYVLSPRFSHDKSVSPLPALQGSIVIVALVAICQVTAAWMGWNFPYSFFNSNPAYMQATEVDIEGLRRVNATFTEPSTAGGFLAAAALGLLAMRLFGKAVSLFLIGLVVAGLIFTTAATGYLALFGGVGLLFFYFAVVGWHNVVARRILRRLMAVVLLALSALTFLLVVAPPLRQAVIESTVNKGDTFSFIARTSMDLYSLQLLITSYGLGVGLGSNRPSSFAAYLLSDVGVIGTLFFVIFIARIFRQLLSRTRAQSRQEVAIITWMLAGLLLAQIFGIPDLSWPPLWAVLISACSLLTSRNNLDPAPAYLLNPLPAKLQRPQAAL